MACCSADATSKEIDNEIKKESKKNSKEYKILLLGAGESGKSTIAKQMQIIHAKDNPFSAAELAEYVPVIHNNIVQSVVAVLEYMEATGEELRSKTKKYRDVVFELAQNQSCLIDEEFGAKLKAIIEDKNFQKALDSIHKFQFPERVLLFFNDIERISKSDFVPTIDDVLSARRRTTGVREVVFKNGSNCYRMVDVGGQKSERKKWFHFFEGVTAVIYVVALSEYNLMMFEDPTVNRMHDSLNLFKEIANSQWFTSSATILFLNKTDLFEDKIKKVSLKVCFDNYKGKDEYEPALSYIKKKFLAVRESKQTIFVHTTNATDTQNVRVVFAAVEDTILHQNIKAII